MSDRIETGRRHLCIGFSLTATWLRGKDFTREDGTVEQKDTVAFYTDLAKRSEAAKLDFVFKPDTLNHNPAMVGKSSGFVGLDPTLMLATLARETDRIGLVTTASTTFNPPYVMARQIQSLHWLSDGRAGWNIVTSIEGAENFGLAEMPSPQERYAKAEEATEIVRQLWQSYPYEALCYEAGVEEKNAAPIDYTGDHFSVKGPLNVPGHRAGPPPLFQAGASDTGRNFAASVADAIFAATPDIHAGIDLRSDLQKRAVAQGRPADAVRVLPGLYFFLGKTREEAFEMHRAAHAFYDTQKRIDSVKSVLGLDLTGVEADRRVTPDMLPNPDRPVRSRTHADLLRRYIEREQPTVEVLLARPEVVGSAHWVSLGTVEDVVNDVEDWFREGAMDGFIALPGGSSQSVDLFFDEMVPMLVERGLFRKDYSGSTLREHLGLP
ncbi:FMN-dependent oxidoreductase, nitrilotriacetate monooxygenase family [Nitratireductor aquibiodomus]|uniref:FMN-dependent oxidoreductase, nitrilotriacetate monooxygenase family n=1 Tax=Nitratireductor aquibiodomus TaxID=204799 RepID=A0A1H4JST2_9HYPH|nr:NtaA/DmoA family FMN-dependent monooxygenase [Nitratireductor aquibiodomus]SEB49293.1 FMN-dependent oxidoreductase, nitrilotriacetate monooxygenase family [Nitratireductor aquibiodomus]